VPSEEDKPAAGSKKGRIAAAGLKEVKSFDIELLDTPSPKKGVADCFGCCFCFLKGNLCGRKGKGGEECWWR